MITMVILQDGSTALYRASEEGHSAVVQLLVEAGAFLDVQTNVRNSLTCMHISLMVTTFTHT